jgi:hypothetical protein
MELLLVNPPDTTMNYIFALLEKEIDLTVVVTHNRFNAEMLDRSLIKVIDLETSQWDKTLEITSAISWNRAGQDFLDSIAGQIVLSNSTELLQQRQRLQVDPKIQVGTYMIDLLSYKGRHVLCSVMIRKEEIFRFQEDQDSEEFKNNVETAFQTIDSAGIINGPSRVFITGDVVALKPSLPDRAFLERKVAKRFLDVWPNVIKFEKENPKKSHLTFYDWVEKHGNAKRYSLNIAG